MAAPARLVTAAIPTAWQPSDEATVVLRATRFVRAARVIGVVAVAVAALVVAAWPLHLPILHTVVPGGAAMKPLTAVCFALAGLSLWLQAQPLTSAQRRRLALGSAAVVELVGLLMLTEHLLRLPVSVGDLLFPGALTATGITTAGRMSMSTALCFVLLGLTLLLLHGGARWRLRAAQALALGVVLFGLVGVEGYLFGMDALFRFTPYATTALHTSLLLVLLGFGVLLARPERGVMAVLISDNAGGRMARRLLPVAMLLPIGIAWPRLQGERLGYYELEVGLAILCTSSIVIFTVVIWLSARRANRIDEERQRAAEATHRALLELTATNERLQAEIVVRERAELETRASEERFSAAFQASPAGMSLSQLAGGRFVMVNDAWLAMTGYTEAAVLGKTVEQVGLVDADEQLALHARVQLDGTQREVDMRFRKADGAVRHGLVSTRTLEVNGETLLLATLIDLTDRVVTEANLRETNRQLEAALSELRVAQQHIIEQERIGALGQLASGIAHDFNNTLGPILGYSDMLLDNRELLDDPQRVVEYLTAINTAAQGAAQVVARLRDFYRRRQNGDAHVPAYLPDLIAQAISLTRPRWKDQAQASGATIDVVTNVADVPLIAGGAGEIRDALVNLIINAVDAMPSGGTITIRARSDHHEVIAEVTDTGLGMSDEVRGRCLEPFFTTKGERGTGLGLSIVHGTLQRHGGVLEIDSVAGRGTTMRIRLPAQPAVSPPSAPVAPPTARRALRVLVVDDEPMMRQVLSRFLAIDDHSVELAANGREALAKLETADFDLVITDRAMPDMGGDELAASVKAQSPSLPVIMLTGFGDLMLASNDLPEGVDLVVPKPTTLARLRLAVVTLVPDPEPHAGLPPASSASGWPPMVRSEQRCGSA
jgi:PAS domain S-box-containing protein